MSPAVGAQAGGRLAICPGSFDPLTLGHVDLVRRATILFDRVVVAILVNEQKTPFLSQAERVELARAVFDGVAGIEVDTFDGLLVDYAARRGASAIVRGLRSAADVDYELPMTLMNRHLRPSVETVFLPTAVELGHISSRLVKEVWRLGGDVRGLVPPLVEARLRERRPGNVVAGL
jgi:pantetheine-phosphate adenylyltransferase